MDEIKSFLTEVRDAYQSLGILGSFELELFIGRQIYELLLSGKEHDALSHELIKYKTLFGFPTYIIHDNDFTWRIHIKDLYSKWVLPKLNSKLK